jgi:chemotaxis signal transduction protein
MENTIEQTLMQETSYDIEDQNDKISIIDFKMITFSLSGKDYAIDIMKVKEIAKAGHFTYVPNTSSFVLGVHNLRGDIIPIIDLRIFFNIPVEERKDDDLENLIVVSVGEQSFGVVVDHIDKVGVKASDSACLNFKGIKIPIIKAAAMAGRACLRLRILSFRFVYFVFS